MVKAGTVVGILTALLILALVMPSVATPSPLNAEAGDIYALVQTTDASAVKDLKAVVNNVYAATGKGKNIWAIIGCTQEQLDSLVAGGYTIVEQRSGDEEECLDYLFQTLDSLAPPRAGHHTMVQSPDGSYSAMDDQERGGPSYNWVEISSTGTPIDRRAWMWTDCDDGWVYPINIGFHFDFYGQTYTQCAISINGAVYFQDVFFSFWNEPIPTPRWWCQAGGYARSFVAPFWTDLWVCTDGQIYYQTLGRSPNRTFVVQWDNVPHLWTGYPNGLTFQVIFYERSNNILFQYKDAQVGGKFGKYYDWGKHATVGIQKNCGRSNGLLWSYNKADIRNGQAILWAPGSVYRSPLLNQYYTPQYPPIYRQGRTSQPYQYPYSYPYSYPYPYQYYYQR